MDSKALVRAQFDKQAESFSNWSVARNEAYMQGYFQFSGIGRGDDLLDVACGTGEFSIFCAKRINRVHGIDISEGMIELARKQAHAHGLSNVTFDCHDGENVPCDSSSFSVVTCRNSYHHMEDYEHVFKEMLRCCKPNGRLSVQDITAYDNPQVNSFFEALEREIDISHHASLYRHEFIDLFEGNRLEGIRSMDVEIELNFREYLGHASQSENHRGSISDLLEYGLRDEAISNFLYLKKDDELILKRKVFLILGQRPGA